ncbi:MAG TPA: hypothetical protein VFQ79_02735 [Bryobacteraceae bacterium]|nr:hypothetical protein [Bryobacteraceae bacterium]
MRLRWSQNVTLAFVFVVAPVHAEDWGALFEALTSIDTQTSDAARKKVFGETLPFLLRADARAVSPEMQGIARQLAHHPRIRLQAIATLASVAYGRRDSAEVLAGVLPELIAHLNDETARIRFDAAFALSHLKPSIPAEAIPHLINARRSRDASLAQGGVFGAARLAEGSTDASEAVAAALRANHNAAAKQFILRAIAANRVVSVLVQDSISDLLETATDVNVLIEALNSATALGSAATERLVRNVDLLVTTTPAVPVAEAAAAARLKLQESRE